MLKTICDMLIGAFVCAAFGAAMATVGQVPLPGFQAPDGTWLLGLAGGQNYTYQSGITAHAGGTQASCFQLAPGIYLYETDTVATTSDSVCIPFAVAGSNFSLRNAGAQTLAIYAQSGTNLVTATTDTINAASNSSPYTVAANNSVECFAAKAGAWSCVHGN